MKFDSQEALHSHVTKFCKESDYSNLDRLDQRFKDLNRQRKDADPFKTNLTLDEIGRFLHQERPGTREEAIGALSLLDLRHRVRDSETEFEKAKKQYVSQREAEVVSELERFRQERQAVRELRNKEEAELMDLVKDLEQKKERELQARIEKEQIGKALRELEKTKLSTLEQEKKRELNKLANERETLRLKEEEIMREAENLRKIIEDQEAAWREERDETLKRGAAAAQPKNANEKMQRDLARDRGEKVAEIKLKKQMLEQERLRIMEDLEKVKKGDLSRVRRNIAGQLAATAITSSPNPKLMGGNVPEHVRRMQEQLQQDEERLERLRKEHHEMTQAPLMPLDKSEKVNFPDEVDGLVRKADEDLPPRERARVLGHIKDNLQGGEGGQSSSRFAPAMQQPVRTIDPPSYWNQSPPQFGNAPVPRAGRLLDDIHTLRNAPQTRYDPTPYPAYTTQPPAPDPQPAEDGEMKGLKKQIKKLQKKLENRDQDEFYQNMQSTLQALQMKLMGMEPQGAAGQPAAGPAFDAKDLTPEEKALQNLSQQEAQDLRLLASIPKDSDLYKAKLEHYREITKERAKMESVLSQLGLERMKRNFQREMELEERKLQNDKWVEEQRRSLILNKMKGEETRPQNMYASMAYNPEAGLILYWDFISGLPTRFTQVQLVYGLFERGESRLPARLVAAVPLEPDSASGMQSRGVFATMQDITKIPPYPQINIVVEVQAMGRGLGDDEEERTKPVGIGWTVLNLFTAGRKLQEGAWKIPIYRQPTDPAIELSSISQLLPVSNMYLYMRLVSPDSLNQSLLNLPVSPDNKSQYAIPLPHQRNELGFAPAGPMDEPRDVPQSRRSNAIRTDQPGPTRNSNPISNVGIGVQLESLLNFLSKSTLKFIVSIQEGQKLALDDRGANCLWTSEAISGLKGDRVSESGAGRVRIPGTNIRADPRGASAARDLDFSGGRPALGSSNNFLEIQQRTSFFQNFYHTLHQNDWRDQVYLIIQIAEKQSEHVTTLGSQDGRVRDTDSFVPIAWTIYQVSNPETHQLQFGSVDLLLYRPPITVPIYDTDQLTQADGTLKITVFEPSAERYMQPASRRSRGNGAPARDEPPAGRREPFIENQTSQFDDGKLFEKGDGVDFYVDTARFLPDNTTCTKIVVKAFTSNLEKVGAPIGGLPELTSSVYSPVYGFRTELRMQIFDPTTLAVVAFQTIDKSQGEVRVLGYAAINLFLHRIRKDQPVTANEQDYIINKGAFQLPIYCQEPYRKPPFSMASFNKLERIPCATVLVRIRAAAKSDDGLRTLGVKDALPSEWLMRGIVVPPPKYEDRIYNTSFCTPTATEKYLYMERVNRPDMTVRDATKLVQQQLGYQLELNNEEMLDWIDQRLQVTPRTGMLDMKYFAQYSPKIGFKFVVDCVHNVPSANAHVVIFSLNPPGTLYQGGVSSQEVHFTTRIDWESAVKTQCYKDGFEVFRNIMFNRSLHMIVDVRSVSFARQTPEVTNVGWTILPIFSDDGFVESGIYQLPLFRGAVPVPILQDLATNKPWEFLNNLVGKRNGPSFLTPVSVIVRLVDAQREGHFNMPMELQRLNYSYIPGNLLSKFSYNAAAMAKMDGQKRLKSIIPNQGAEEPYQKKINQGMANHLGLDHVIT
jgi:hypothetical protein